MANGIPRPLRILVVDDDKTFNRAIEARLAKAGFRIKACFDGESALKAFDASPFDLVVLDLVMPAMPGFAVLEELRVRDAKVPVVVLSLLHQEEDVEKVMRLGATKYLTKSSPTFMDELVRYAEEVSVS